MEVGDSIVTNLDIGDLVPSTSVEGGRWTEEFKKAVIQAVARWHREPEMVQVGKWMARMDADPGAFLKKLSERELKFWKAHVRNNHMPYDRRCSTCVMSTGNGRIHRRIRTPSAFCLSLDICGPFRKRGEDPDHRDYKYALIGAYCLPRDKEVSHGKFSEHGGDKEVSGGKFDERGGDKEVSHGKFGEHGGDKEVSGGKFDERGGDKEVSHGKFGEHGGDKEVFDGKFDERGGDKEVSRGKFGEHGGDKEVSHGKFGERGGDKEVKEVFDGRFGEHGGDKEVSHGNLAKELHLPDMRDLFAESDGETPVVPERDLPDQPKGMTDEEFQKVFKEVEDGLEYQTLYTMRPEIANNKRGGLGSSRHGSRATSRRSSCGSYACGPCQRITNGTLETLDVGQGRILHVHRRPSSAKQWSRRSRGEVCQGSDQEVTPGFQVSSTSMAVGDEICNLVAEGANASARW